MKMNPITRLDNYLKDPASPSWSSQGLIDMFEGLTGDMKDKQQMILPIIDEKLSRVNIPMTNFQFNFLRAVTLHAYYPKTRVEFTLDDLKWLLNRLDEKPSQQRATLIVMLLDLRDLSELRKRTIKEMVKGTLGEPFYYDSNYKNLHDKK